MASLIHLRAPLYILTCAFALSNCGSGSADFRSSWPADVTRPWAGPDYWANPLQDWRIQDGRLENFVAGGNRNVYLLTRELSEESGGFIMSVTLGRMDEPAAGLPGEGYAGFRIGIRGAFDDYRDSAVRGVGLNAGVTSGGRLFIGEVPDETPQVAEELGSLELRLAGRRGDEGYSLRLEALGESGATIGEVVNDRIYEEWLTGGVALVSSSGTVPDTLPPPQPAIGDPGFGRRRGDERGGSVRFWFRDWTLSGSKVRAVPERAYGPILFAMHTLSRGHLKLTAQLAPVGNGSREVRFEMQQADGEWATAGTAQIDPLARTARFSIPDWEDDRDVPYRLVYRGARSTADPGTHYYEGVIRRDPVDQEEIIVAAFTGNNDLGFPHADVAANVSHFQPDLLAFTGDNIYERVGDFGHQREPLDAAVLDYLRKWFMFGWEYGSLMREIPTVAIPDDHDVYHGNLWGAGGRHAEGSGYAGQDQGGYTMPAEFVKAVERTQTSHLPDPYDPAPVEQGIGVYYTSMLYGGVSFAILEDRKWKSAPKEMLPQAKILNGWSQVPGYDGARSDVPAAKLLGDRQLRFLNDWAVDWSGGAWIKAVISQTIFANVATLPRGAMLDDITPKLQVMPPSRYAQGEWPVADHDSNGWPQAGRNKALEAMRKGLAIHIAGDQHLGSTIQYGIQDWGDAGYAICVPSVANVWPRRWYPPRPGGNHQPGAPAYTGDYLDGFGNKMTVLAVSNPAAVDAEPTEINHRAPGYGIITMNRQTREITFANWPRWVRTSEPGARPYDGWPITIHQLDNGFPAKGLTLDELDLRDIPDSVIEVRDEASGEVLYSLRPAGSRFQAKVRDPGIYSIRVHNPDSGQERIYSNLRAP